MATTKECPVCGSDIKLEVVYVDRVPMSEHCECSKCGKFRCEFTADTARITIDGKELITWRGASPEEQKQFETDLKTRCEIVERQVNHGSH